MKLGKVNELFYSLEGYEPIDINNGHCYHWAYIVSRLWGGKLYYTEDHAFVKICDKFYDAEAIRGVKNWRNLPAFETGYSGKAKPAKTIREFKDYWNDEGAYGWMENLCKMFIRALQERSFRC